MLLRHLCHNFSAPIILFLAVEKMLPSLSAHELEFDSFKLRLDSRDGVDIFAWDHHCYCMKNATNDIMNVSEPSAL